MGGKVVGVVDMWEIDFHRRPVISVVSIAVHEEKFRISPLETGVDKLEGFVVFRVWICVGNVVDKVRVGICRPGKYFVPRELQDCRLEIFRIGRIAE